MVPFWTRPSRAFFTTCPRPGAAHAALPDEDDESDDDDVDGFCALAGRTVLTAKTPAPRATTMPMVVRSFFMGLKVTAPC
jgi:hypothetical protein